MSVLSLDEVVYLSEWIHKNFVHLNVYFKTKVIQQRVQSPSFDMASLWCNVGGILGLWVGISVVSVTEGLVMVCKLFLVVFAYTVNKFTGNLNRVA